jgi:Protein of unknown function (DUF2442)
MRCYGLMRPSRWSRSIASGSWQRISNGMVGETTRRTSASRGWVERRRICPVLSDGRTVSSAAAKYPLLANATQPLLERAKLRVGGLALRWEELDEDPWVEGVLRGRFPRASEGDQ